MPKHLLKRFRALLFQIDKCADLGPEGKRWGFGPNVFTSLVGFAAFVRMVEPEKGVALQTQALALAGKHGCKAPKRPVYEKAAEPSWVRKKRQQAVVAAAEAARASAAPSPAATGRGAVGPEPPKSAKKWWQFWKKD